MKYLFVILSCLFLTSCANSLHERTYCRYLETGLAAQDNNDPVLAEVAYYRALKNVYWGHLGTELEAKALYNLGSMERVNGKLDLSLEHLLKALDLDENSNIRDINNIVGELAEIAKTYYDQQEFIKGSQYLDRAQKIIEPVEEKGIFSAQSKRFLKKIFLEYAEEIASMGLEVQSQSYKTFADGLTSL